MSSEDWDLVESMLADTNIDIDSIPYTAPPGEEGIDFSHEGGEHEVFEGLAQQMADLSGWYAIIFIILLIHTEAMLAVIATMWICTLIQIV